MHAYQRNDQWHSLQRQRKPGNILGWHSWCCFINQVNPDSTWRGTSTNGGSAFGASVNLQTNSWMPSRMPMWLPRLALSIHNDTRHARALVLFISIGLSMPKVSKILSDGYVDRASSDLSSYCAKWRILWKKTVPEGNRVWWSWNYLSIMVGRWWLYHEACEPHVQLCGCYLRCRAICVELLQKSGWWL